MTQEMTPELKKQIQPTLDRFEFERWSMVRAPDPVTGEQKLATIHWFQRKYAWKQAIQQRWILPGIKLNFRGKSYLKASASTLAMFTFIKMADASVLENK